MRCRAPDCIPRCWLGLVNPPLVRAGQFAVSGGADSLALLLLLWAHWPERRSRLQVLHFNHRLRGRASRTDEVFCRKVCAGCA